MSIIRGWNEIGEPSLVSFCVDGRWWPLQAHFPSGCRANTAYCWCCSCEGVQLLACSILFLVTGSDLVAQCFAEKFGQEILVNLSPEEWQMEYEDVRRWMTKKCEELLFELTRRELADVSQNGTAKEGSTNGHG